MSTTTNDKNDPQPTPGEWQIATSCSWRRIVNERMEPVCVPIRQTADGHPDLHFPNGGPDGPDARLMTTAGVVADKLPDRYDAIELLRNLPEIARLIDRMHDETQPREAPHMSAPTRTLPSWETVDNLIRLLQQTDSDS